MNYHDLPKKDKEVLKSVISEIRKVIYETDDGLDLLEDGLVVNFGKKEEERVVIKLETV